jgi:hypothetical protein
LLLDILLETRDNLSLLLIRIFMLLFKVLVLFRHCFSFVESIALLHALVDLCPIVLGVIVVLATIIVTETYILLVEGLVAGELLPVDESRLSALLAPIMLERVVL